MIINGTIIVQMIHFAIAYVLIDRLLLRPAVGIIEREKNDYNLLLQAVEVEQQAIAEQEEIKLTRWHKFQKQFLQSAPRLDECSQEVGNVSATPLLIEPISSLQQERYKEDIEKYLIERLSVVK